LIDELAGTTEPAELLTDPDEVPEDVETRCKPGDLWILGSHRLLCGDSTKVDDVERLMDGAIVGLVYTDPPYGMSVVASGMVGADFGVAKKGNYSPVIGDDSTDTAICSYKVLQSLSDRMILWGGNYYADALPPSSCWLIWDKRSDSGIENTFADAELAWTSMTGATRVYRQLWNGMIREGEREKRVHPTQKPINLALWAITKYANDGVIVDAFLGSGTTLIACEQISRHCYGLELDPHYCDVIIQRWENATGQKAVLSEG
jgi:16S rRNA G966 N2-methylase RsmD